MDAFVASVEERDDPVCGRPVAVGGNIEVAGRVWVMQSILPQVGANL